MTTTTILERFEALCDEGVISPIDVEFSRFLCNVEPDADQQVLLAGCLVSAAYQDGNVCILLNDYEGRELFDEAPENLRLVAPDMDEWISKLSKSPLVGHFGDFKPLILDDAHRLYLHKLWHNEQNLIQQILAKIKASAPRVDVALLQDGLQRLFNEEEEVNWQKVAAIAAVNNAFTVISGGPGTGKTTTVVRLLALLMEQGRSRGNLPNIALAAPTGKAAARLEASILEAKGQLKTDDEITEAIPDECQTIHQLLGASRHTSHFRHNEENPLPYDYIIIDEVSMVDQALLSRLMDATLTQTRLLFLGDKDQLASVEAGSVLGDLCADMKQNRFTQQMHDRLQKFNINLPEPTLVEKSQPLVDHIILLTKSYRFSADSGIGQLVKTVNRGAAAQAWNLLSDPKYPDISNESFSDYSAFIDRLSQPITKQFEQVRAAESPLEMLALYRRHKILAAHRGGPWGVQAINSSMERILKRKGLISPYENWYAGRPVIINSNDYSLGLSNGDLGVCAFDEEGTLKVFFQTDDHLLSIAPGRLPDHATAFALTVHKSQGSEFDEISFILPAKISKILSRELIYTAVSRARKRVVVFSGKEVFFESIQRTAARNSGLKDHLWN